MQAQIQEIKNYIEHKDYSLAVRRLLDTCLDTNDAHLLQKAIYCSKEFNGSNNVGLFEKNAKEILAILNSQNINKQPKLAQKLIEINKISKTYSKGNFSLKPISLTVETSNIIGVVGENGNGKTTFLRCLSRQLDIDGGSIYFSLLNKPDDYSIKHHIAFIPQRIPKWYGFLKDNLHFSASLSGIKGKQNELMVDYMLERLNLTKYANLTWSQISSGYRTRFEIARILLQKPTLLILDEPLANLDINAQQTILTDLSYIAKCSYNPMGVILSSQQLHEVEKVADNVIFIKKGECIFNTKDYPLNSNQNYAIEFETTAKREEILLAFNEDDIQLQFNGGYYTLTSNSIESQSMIKSLVEKKIMLNYFRDITHSTKRFF